MVKRQHHSFSLTQHPSNPLVQPTAGLVLLQKLRLKKIICCIIRSEVGYTQRYILIKFSIISLVISLSRLLQLVGQIGTGNTKGGSITVLLTSCLTGLESAVSQLTIFFLFAKETNLNQTGGQQYSDTSPFSIPWKSSQFVGPRVVPVLRLCVQLGQPQIFPRSLLNQSVRGLSLIYYSQPIGKALQPSRPALRTCQLHWPSW